MASRSSRVRLGIITLSTIILAGTANAAILPSKLEQKCLKKLGKLSTKFAGTVANETAACRDADINGSVVGACPNATNLTKIDSIGDKLVAAAVSSCKSVCAVSQDIECISDGFCPPLAGGFAESCSAGAANLPFEIRRIGFPGPYCDAILGAPMRDAADIGECSRGVGNDVAESLIDALYGSVTNVTAVSSGASECLAAASKSVQKLATTTAKMVGKCRAAINKGKVAGDPKNCATADEKTAAKIEATAQAVRDTVAATCSLGELAELDLCGLGIGGIASVTEAQECLVALGREVGDSSEVPASRLFAPVSIIEAAYPPRPVCGDGAINQIPNPFLLLGEECDGDDDAACPGLCLPPGDLFECTCGDRPRVRAFASTLLTDADAGWTGNAHDQGNADQSGFIVNLSNCDCDGFIGADCTGSSTDPVCDVTALTQPFCSWDTTHTLRCDDIGNNDNKDRDSDCTICDSFSVNAGAPCKDGEDCQAQCYDGGGVATGPCDAQGDCASGETCLGRCDDTQTCIVTNAGGPFPVAAAGAAVCNAQKFRTGITGTRNLVTAESEMAFEMYSITHLGERTSRPCPVCGGFCVGGSQDLEVCAGRCETSDDPCRFDSDCPGIDEKCSDQSPDCPDGFCQLQLICGTEPGSNDAVEGVPCRIEFESPYFGTPSSDCPPASGKNIGGEGFLVKHQPTGSELKTLPFAVPCTAAGYELFDCPCPSDGGQPTQPNACTPACDAAGPSFGVGCADGNSSGQGTRCAGGSNNDKPCDENSDCPGGACSNNPTHCSGDPSFDRFGCTTNADCGAGTCGDACPGGRCVPLCVPEPGDPEEGLCAAGPDVYSCENAAFGFVNCTKAAAEAGCAATCSVSATPCDSISDCPNGETCQGECESAQDCEAGADGTIGTDDDLAGAGPCIGRDRGCNLDPIAIEGGDIFNGRGDNTNYLRSSIWCFGRTLNAGINAASGFGGPGTIRERGVNVLNVDSIP